MDTLHIWYIPTCCPDPPIQALLGQEHVLIGEGVFMSSSFIFWCTLFHTVLCDLWVCDMWMWGGDGWEEVWRVVGEGNILKRGVYLWTPNSRVPMGSRKSLPYDVTTWTCKWVPGIIPAWNPPLIVPSFHYFWSQSTRMWKPSFVSIIQLYLLSAK